MGWETRACDRRLPESTPSQAPPAGDSLIEVSARVKQHRCPAGSAEVAGEWITWPEAAEIVGCPVPTIEHYAREGHITKRPRRGARPSLLRSSVEEFATRWRDITAAREAARESARQERERTRSQRRQREPKPTSVVPAGLVNSAQAAELLDRDRHHLAYLGQDRTVERATPWWALVVRPGRCDCAARRADDLDQLGGRVRAGRLPHLRGDPGRPGRRNRDPRRWPQSPPVAAAQLGRGMGHHLGRTGGTPPRGSRPSSG